MQMGTRSVLFGAHQFILHPLFIACAWWKLYGFPWDPRLWVAFFVHDLGYLGKPNMDGPEGESHPWFGAKFTSWLFDTSVVFPSRFAKTFGRLLDLIFGQDAYGMNWYSLVLYHSRFIARKYDLPKVSKLCVADKLCIAITPAWLYLPMAKATGEIKEYMRLAKAWHGSGDDERQWYADVQAYLRRWVEQHKDGREDTWTDDLRKAKTASGVWQ